MLVDWEKTSVWREIQPPPLPPPPIELKGVSLASTVTTNVATMPISDYSTAVLVVCPQRIVSLVSGRRQSHSFEQAWLHRVATTDTRTIPREKRSLGKTTMIDAERAKAWAMLMTVVEEDFLRRRWCVS